MKYTDISGKNLSELNALLKEKKVLLFTLRQKLKTMQLTNPNEIRETKKDIARINTEIRAAKQGVNDGSRNEKRNSRCRSSDSWE